MSSTQIVAGAFLAAENAVSEVSALRLVHKLAAENPTNGAVTNLLQSYGGFATKQEQQTDQQERQMAKYVKKEVEAKTNTELKFTDALLLCVGAVEAQEKIAERKIRQIKTSKKYKDMEEKFQDTGLSPGYFDIRQYVESFGKTACFLTLEEWEEIEKTFDELIKKQKEKKLKQQNKESQKIEQKK